MIYDKILSMTIKYHNLAILKISTFGANLNVQQFCLNKELTNRFTSKTCSQLNLNRSQDDH